MSTRGRAAIIGAGAAGLSAARHLIEAGVEVVVYEKGSYVGGLWVYDNDNGLSVAYSSLHINSEPSVTHFHGYPFDPEVPTFPSHRDVAAYLENFSHAARIREHIRFNHHVTGVAPPDAGGLRTVTLADGSNEQFETVIIATGHQGKPRHVPLLEAFEGRYLHARQYRAPEDFQSDRVLVVGAGNSGLDIAADLAPVAESTTMSARSPVLIMPRMLFGAPTARTLGRISKPWVPWLVQRTAMRAISRVVHGPMEKWGLQTPKTRTHPATTAMFMTHVAYDRIAVRPGISSIFGHTVTFTDGRSEEFDTIIGATGYVVDLAILDEAESPLSGAQGERLDLFHRVVHPTANGLYFIGFFNVSGGANISMMDVQSQWVVDLITGRTSIPSVEAMQASIQEERDFLARNFPGSARYGLELVPGRYRRKITRERSRGPTTR